MSKMFNKKKFFKKNANIFKIFCFNQKYILKLSFKKAPKFQQQQKKNTHKSIPKCQNISKNSIFFQIYSKNQKK